MINTRVPLKWTIKSLEKAGEFWGYASTRAVDQASDQILTGAFGRTIADWQMKKGRFPHIFWQHDMEEFIGVCQKLEEDKHGLLVKGKLLMDIPKAKYAYELLQRGMDGLSIGFFTTKSEMKSGVRQISELALKEISFVDNPCNREATIYEYKINDHVLKAIKRLKKTLIT